MTTTTTITTISEKWKMEGTGGRRIRKERKRRKGRKRIIGYLHPPNYCIEGFYSSVPETRIAI